jgi:two-component system, OmpR family, KDP operon response regulator KdpE
MGAGLLWSSTDPVDIDSLLARLDAPGPASHSIPRVAESAAVRTMVSLCPLVLLVDSDHQSRQASTHALEAAGFEVRTAHDGLQALDLLAEGEADYVVVDLDLEGTFSGPDVLDVLRSTMEWVHLPVIVYSHTPMPTLHQLRAVFGADHYVAKDEGASALVARLNTIREARRAGAAGPGAEP